jgi:putative phage-type endonuclease
MNIIGESTIPDEYKDIDKRVKALAKVIQYEQRTTEWYNYRKNKITASDCAAAINMNPYESRKSFIYKKCTTSPFYDNDAVFHGRKYERIALLIYQQYFDVLVDEYGSIPSSKYNFLGASPDGVCTSFKLNDMTFSNKYGTMIEIKCPVKRKIETGENLSYYEKIMKVCPYYYYCQIQQQLECCDLDICDFWQCEIKEYENEDDFIKDNMDKTYIYDDGVRVENNIVKKGVLMEYHPINPKFNNIVNSNNGEINPGIESKIEWQSHHIYPNRLHYDPNYYLKYFINQYNNLDIKDHKFHKPKYWKILKCCNISIKRNDIFWNNIYPMLKETWRLILYYKKNKELLNSSFSDNKMTYIKIPDIYEYDSNLYFF